MSQFLAPVFLAGDAVKLGNGLGEHARPQHRQRLLPGHPHKLLGSLRLGAMLVALAFGEMEGAGCQTPQIDDGMAIGAVGQGGDKRFDTFPSLAGIGNAEIQIQMTEP